MLGKGAIKWRQRPDMTIAVDWDVKHQFKQTKLEGGGQIQQTNTTNKYFSSILDSLEL